NSPRCPYKLPVSRVGDLVSRVVRKGRTTVSRLLDDLQTRGIIRALRYANGRFATEWEATRLLREAGRRVGWPVGAADGRGGLTIARWVTATCAWRARSPRAQGARFLDGMDVRPLGATPE